MTVRGSGAAAVSPLRTRSSNRRAQVREAEGHGADEDDRRPEPHPTITRLGSPVPTTTWASFRRSGHYRITDHRDTSQSRISATGAARASQSPEHQRRTRLRLGTQTPFMSP